MRTTSVPMIAAAPALNANLRKVRKYILFIFSLYLRGVSQFSGQLNLS